MLNNDDERYCTTKYMNKFKKSKMIIHITNLVKSVALELLEKDNVIAIDKEVLSIVIAIHM